MSCEENARLLSVVSTSVASEVVIENYTGRDVCRTIQTTVA